MAKMIGSIGCTSISPARFGKKRFSFNGTTKDLVISAYHAGARAGDKIEANYGGGFREYRLVSAPHDDRAFYLWIA